MIAAGNHGNTVRDWMVVRPMRPDDRGKVASDWTVDLRRNAVKGSWPRLMEWTEYSTVTNAIVDDVMRVGTVLVAADSEMDDHILGWLAMTPGTLHYAFTVPKMRRLGVFTTLYRAAGLDRPVITHLTYVARKVMRRYGWRYVPAFNL